VDASRSAAAKVVTLGTVAKRGSRTQDEAKEQVQLQPEPVNIPPAEKQSNQSMINKLAVGIVVGFVASRIAKFLAKRVLGLQKEPSLSDFLKTTPQKQVTAPKGTNGAAITAPAARKRATPSAHKTTREALDLIETKTKKYIIVGGKGGVGKTSMSAALATKFADMGQTTLIISTDPAHSLSDVFDCDVKGGEPVPVLGIDGLYAQEVNPQESLSEVGQMGTIPGMEELGMEELSSLFETVPPGMDEAIALVQIVRFIEGDPDYQRFERIVFDTAPTGHTLRLLTLPDFLDSFFGKIVSMKSKFANLMNSMKGMFGGAEEDPFDGESMEEMKKSMKIVRDLFRDETQTEFIVATIPNLMAISESTRLVETLRDEDIPVQHVFINMVQPENDDCAFCSARRKEQQSNLSFIRQAFDGMQISPVQFFDREIRGAYGLRAMGEQLLPKSTEPPSKPQVDLKEAESQSAL